MALSRSIGEVRALPYPEYRSWQIFYMLEPWGWHNEEYQTAAIVSMIHNTNVGKKRDAKKVSEFVRDMQKAALKEVNEAPVIDDEISEADKQRMIEQAKRDFGIR